MNKRNLFTFTPLMRTTLWGGTQLPVYKGINTDLTQVGESWELSAVESGETVVAEGEYAGKTLRELTELLREELVGKENYRLYGSRFPLLVKFIDADQDLSVQVHPNDALAQKRHHCPGKNEMWYVVQAASEARLYSGFNRVLTPDEYEERVAASTLPEVLRAYEVRPGDVFYLPAGCVHSLGRGCLVCEIQQSSDITYRIYDYNRRDAEGNLRTLHTAEAREAIRFEEIETRMNRPVEDNVPCELVRSPYFTTSLYRLTEPMSCDYSSLDSFVILICTEGACRVTVADEEVCLRQGQTVLVAARCGGVTLQPEGKVSVLETFV
ncbi:MAG: class I mannose-6-phosphate isomerase [Clostridium sp.]|nr:class I mannose-6-phosphate isomerase [Clostridium sp.]